MQINRIIKWNIFQTAPFKIETLSSGQRNYFLFIFSILFSGIFSQTFSQGTASLLNYTVSIPRPESHIYEVELRCNNWMQDTILLKMPRWMPGYYQIIEYSNSVEKMTAMDGHQKNIPIKKLNENTWLITGIKNKSFLVKYSVKTERQFVANSYVDNAHAYLVPENTFCMLMDF